MQLVFASSNPNKIKEIQELVPAHIEILGLKDIGCNEEIEETGTTFSENALIKARFIYQNYKLNCFADDSGLEVKALNNEPGVYSARYAGEPKNDLNNLNKLLAQMKGKTERNARFRTVIALLLDGKEHSFEGEITGTITLQPLGHEGFGYDPVFIPDGYSKTFAQMAPAEKNAISHRAKAVKKLVGFLKSTV